MKNTTRKIKTALIVSALVMSSAVPFQASAGGFIGDLIGGSAGRNLDNWHKNAGQPLDNAFEGALDYYAPGVGTARKYHRIYNSRISNRNYSQRRSSQRFNNRSVRNCFRTLNSWGRVVKVCR